jgi:uncharacterized membrane protein YgcG
MLYKNKNFILLLFPTALSLSRAQNLNLNKLPPICSEKYDYFYTSPLVPSLSDLVKVNKINLSFRVGAGRSPSTSLSCLPKELTSAKQLTKDPRTQLLHPSKRHKWLSLVLFTLVFLTILAMNKHLLAGEALMETARKPLFFTLDILSRLAQSLTVFDKKTRNMLDAAFVGIGSFINNTKGMKLLETRKVSSLSTLADQGTSALVNTLQHSFTAGSTAAHGVETANNYQLFKHALNKGYEICNTVLPSGQGLAFTKPTVSSPPSIIPPVFRIPATLHASAAFLRCVSTPIVTAKKWTLGLKAGRATGFFLTIPSGLHRLPWLLTPFTLQQKRKKLRKIFSNSAHHVEKKRKALSDIPGLPHNKGHAAFLRLANAIPASIRKTCKGIDRFGLKETGDPAIQRLLELMMIASARVNHSVENSKQAVLRDHSTDPFSGSRASLMQESKKLIRDLGDFVYAITGKEAIDYSGPITPPGLSKQNTNNNKLPIHNLVLSPDNSGDTPSPGAPEGGPGQSRRGSNPSPGAPGGGPGQSGRGGSSGSGGRDDPSRSGGNNVNSGNSTNSSPNDQRKIIEAMLNNLLRILNGRPFLSFAVSNTRSDVINTWSHETLSAMDSLSLAINNFAEQNAPNTTSEYIAALIEQGRTVLQIMGIGDPNQAGTVTRMVNILTRYRQFISTLNGRRLISLGTVLSQFNPPTTMNPNDAGSDIADCDSDVADIDSINEDEEGDARHTIDYVLTPDGVVVHPAPSPASVSQETTSNSTIRTWIRSFLRLLAWCNEGAGSDEPEDTNEHIPSGSNESGASSIPRAQGASTILGGRPSSSTSGVRSIPNPTTPTSKASAKPKAKPKPKPKPKAGAMPTINENHEENPEE